ncbi:MAG: cytochrome C [Rickettsiales bacterium]|nr:cytochrome C [Rickettsiales bacterium]
MKSIHLFIFKIIFLAFILMHSKAYTQSKIDYGLLAFKRGNCMGCHKWHGDGGPGYGGAAMSLRDTGLDKEGLILLIACGRPGTNMPFFDKKAYVDDRCFGMKFHDFEGDEKNRPLQAKVYLNKRQIEAVTNFILTDLKGKKLSKEYCLKFFGKPTRSCEGL